MGDYSRFQAGVAALNPPLRPEPEPPLPAITTPAGRPVWYPDNAILTTEEVAEVLRVDVRTVKRMKIRRCYAGGRTVRFLFRDVLAFLEERAA